MKIGQLAHEAGVTIQTIRYYERIGLLSAQTRSKSGYRFYQQENLLRLRFIGKAKSLGFSLKKIKELLELRLDPSTNCNQIKDKAERKQAEISAKIAFLAGLNRTLSKLIQDCSSSIPNAPCPILLSLELE